MIHVTADGWTKLREALQKLGVTWVLGNFVLTLQFDINGAQSSGSCCVR